MKPAQMFLSVFLLFALTACRPAVPQPIFTPSAEATATPIPLPPATPQVTATLPGVIWSFDVSAVSNIIAFATSKGVVLYDFKTLDYLRTLNEGENVFSLAWSPDGTKLAVGILKEFQDHGEAVLTVWDTSTWQIVFQPTFENNLVNERILDIAWSPDSRSIAISTDFNGVIAFDVESGKIISHQKEFASSVMDIDWSPDGSRLISTSDMAYGIRRWKVKNDEAVRLFDQRVSNPMQVAWSPDGKRIASGHAYGTVCFWTAATNKCDGFIQAHRSAVFSLAWSPDGAKLATGGGVIRIWDTQTGELLTAFGEDERFIYTHIAWPALDRPLVALETGLDDLGETVVRFWDISTGEIVAEVVGGER